MGKAGEEVESEGRKEGGKRRYTINSALDTGEYSGHHNPFLQPLSTVDSHNTTTPAHQGITPGQPSDKRLWTIHACHPSALHPWDRSSHLTQSRKGGNLSSLSPSAQDGSVVCCTRLTPVCWKLLPPWLPSEW